MQAPGGPNEDTSGDFKYGGWTVGYWDSILDKAMGEQMAMPFDLLLGRKPTKYSQVTGPTPKTQ